MHESMYYGEDCEVWDGPSYGRTFSGYGSDTWFQDKLEEAHPKWDYTNCIKSITGRKFSEVKDFLSENAVEYRHLTKGERRYSYRLNPHRLNLITENDIIIKAFVG